MNKYISMKCPNCGATMQVDRDKMIKFCPYCGSADLIEESDDVKKTRMKVEADRDVKINKDNLKYSTKKAAAESKVNEEKYSAIWMIAYAIMIIVFLIFLKSVM